MSSGMQKVGTGAKLEDSNIANYGSKEHKDAKKAAANAEPAWDNAGKVVGIQVWRVEKFKIIAWPTTKYGQFFSGDAYIILNTYKKPDSDSDALLYNLHFWLGKDCTQDEMGTAAYKTVELDDKLNDVPVQYREVEGHESEEFLGCFKGKITTMAGGVDSGFNHVKPTEYRPRLLHLKSTVKKSVRVSEVPGDIKNLNDGDVFILDLGLDIIQWNGLKASIAEKRKAVDVIAALNNDRNNKCKITILDGLEKHGSFWKTIGSPDGAPPAAVNAATPDDAPAPIPTLFRLSDASGKLTMTEEGKGPKIDAKKLDGNDVFLLDVGDALFVWLGKKISDVERAKWLDTANNYLTSAKRDPMAVSYRQVKEGLESAEFKTYFSF